MHFQTARMEPPHNQGRPLPLPTHYKHQEDPKKTPKFTKKIKKKKESESIF